ncbi:MAG: molybdopterin-guanine dinucleotide biosynthesis protein B, partial [Parasporobacterium sp.]|nr:molybdopterin-guanine dinucleotide biosynthesis protein B [Parasporobacterium sp.]
MKKLISFIGYSGSGKTTFIEKLVAELKSRGLKVAVIKHDAHEFIIDKEGKDTYRYYENGADVVAIFSGTQTAIYGRVEQLDPDKAINAFLDNFSPHIDIVIVEGWRDANVPKIGVSRLATGKGLSLPAETLAAVITDDPAISHNKKFGLE